MPRPCGACEFEEIVRADDVGADIGFRVFERVAHAGLRREMDHNLGLGDVKGAGEGVAVLELRLDRGEERRLF